MSCNLFVNNSDILSELNRRLGTNNTQILALLTEVAEQISEDKLGIIFNEDFAKSIKDRLEIDVNNISSETNDKTIKEIVDYIQEYYNRKHPDINTTAVIQNESTSVGRFGYCSVSDRQYCIHAAANFAIISENNRKNKGSDIVKKLKEVNDALKAKGKKPMSKVNYIASEIIANVKKEITRRLVERGICSETEAKEALKDIAKLEKYFGENINVQDSNLLAMYKETQAGKETRNAFFEEVFRDSRLGDLRIDNVQEIADNSEYEAFDEQNEDEESEENNEQPNNDKNNSINELNNKMGLYNSYMSHINNSIKNYFNGLQRLHSNQTNTNGSLDYNVDNVLGIPDTMNAEQCAAVLYSNGDFTNVRLMIESIKRIANDMPGFAAFHTFAKDLENNPDFAFEVYRTFGKYVVSKIETIKEGDALTSRTSNRNSDKETSLKFEYLNSVKHTSLYYDNITAGSEVSHISEEISRLKSLVNASTVARNTEGVTEEDINEIENQIKQKQQELIENITKQLRRYYPTVDKASIANYITNAHDGNITNNMANLVSILTNTIKASKKTQDNYANRRVKISEKYKALNELNEQRINGLPVSQKKIDAIQEEIDALQYEEYVDKDSQTAAFTLANELLNYTFAKIEFNSRNAQGNQSSDVINNSMITNIMNTLKSEIALGNFGKYKSQSRQYDFSNIMVEHRDENGRIINYGLFIHNKETNEFTPTPYAKSLLKAQLFNGGSNLGSSTHALYSEMSRGDYIATAFINFNEVEESYEIDGNKEAITFANYFMRIPSDAPKNFSIRAPKYSIRPTSENANNGLFITETKEDGTKIKKVNTNHPVYKQFYNILIQELTDAAIAIDTIFDHSGGVINRDENGLPKFKQGFANDAVTARSLYQGYHVEKNKTIFEVDKTGKAKFTGKVFTSDRFTLTKTAEDGTVDEENYGNKIFEQAFSLPYGGTQNAYLPIKQMPNGIAIDESKFTDEQKRIIEEQLSKFIIDYCKDAISRVENYKSLISENHADKLSIAEFALNYHIAYTAFNDLFEGDTKFYKNSQDFLKRAKEVQGSGVPYGIVDYNEALDAPIHSIPSSLDNTNYGIELRNRFKAVTIKNTVRTAKEVQIGETEEQDGALVKALTKTLKGNREKAISMMEGFAGTTVNDAQSYITFEEWVRRITARGQLAKYKPLIERVIAANKAIEENPDAEIDLDAETIGEFIQVQKNFYYDINYNKRLGMFAPRQIKNAEFVLVPCLIRGTQLAQVYDLMHKNDIDQLNTEETSKAGKTNVLTLWDNEGNITQESINDFEANIGTAYELYNYNYLYTQQETPQHINSENKAGIQIMKKIVDNIDSKTPKLKALKDKFMKLYSENIKESFTTLMNEFNLELDENGNLKLDNDGNIQGLDYKIFFDRLKEEVARLGLDSNMMDYVTLDDIQLSDDAKNGIAAITKMPTYMSSVSTKLESIAQSLFNSRITRQKLPGFHAAQITSVGFDARKGKVAKSKDLAYHPDGKPYIEVMLPASNFGLNRYKKDGTRKTDEELLKELQDAGLDELIGYRIPTEGKQSVCIMKVVGFTDDALGSTIVVPDGWVAQTGSDFDIDSVYGINYKGKINEETGILERIGSKDTDPTSRDERNNQILDCMIEILKHPSSLEENLSRSNFEEIIKARNKAIDKNVQKRRKFRSSYNFFDNAEMQEDVMSGAKLKAFSVTRDTFCSICNTVRPTISQNSTVKVIYRGKDGYKKEDLVARFGKDNVEEVEGKNYFVVTHDKIGWSKDNKNVDGHILTAYSSQTTAHILDAVKEGAIPNVNDLTFQVYKTFPDIGSNYDTGVAFIMQPGVGYIVNAYNATKSIYVDSNSKPIFEALKTIGKEIMQLHGIPVSEKTTYKEVMAHLTQYSEQVAAMFGAKGTQFKVGLNPKEAAKLLIDSKMLRDRLKGDGYFKDTTSPVGKERALLFDLGVILQYNKLSKLSDAIASTARVCNPDKFGAKQSIFATNEVFNEIRKQLRSKNPVLVTDGKNMLSAIYPGMTSTTTVDEFIQSTNMSSAYPPLHYFLKYATATSIKVSRKLFEMQDEKIVEELKKLEYLFTTGKLDEKTYVEFQRYVLSNLYNQTICISQAATSSLKGNNLRFNPETNQSEERARIFGYNRNANLLVKDKHDNVVTFEVHDITRPTREEIDEFAQLSPAQKVDWIQQNFSESGIFKYLRVNLFNSSKTGSKAGSQTIEYIDGNVNIEQIYNEFEKCFFNTNPLVKLAALDIIKYAFVVEGFSMKRTSVNKVIRNTALMTDVENGGTGFIGDMSGKISGIANRTIDMDIIRHNFIRSHSSMSQIPSRYIKTVKVKGKPAGRELTPRANDGIIIVDNNVESQRGFIEKYALGTIDDKGGFVANHYIKLRSGKVETLYEIHDISVQQGEAAVVLTPLNLLEANEHSEFSVNPKNNRFYTRDYYLNIVQQIKDSYNYEEYSYAVPELDLTETTRQTKLKTEANQVNKVVGNFAKSFNINSEKGQFSGGFEIVRDKIAEHFQNNTEPLFVRSGALSHFITQTGEINGSVQTINGKKYRIEKISITKNDYKHPEKKAEGLRKLIETANEEGYKLNDVFIVKPYVEPSSEVNPNVMESSVTEQLGEHSMSTMYRRQVSEGDTEAMTHLNQLHDKGITAASSSVAANLNEVILSSSEYVQNTVNKILNDLQYFIQDENGVYYSVSDNKTFDLIRNDPKARNRFLKTLLDARAFVKNYQLVNNVDIASEDPAIQNALTKLKEAINKLENSTIINQAEEKFADNFLAKLSTNPMVQQDVISLLDGYHSAGAFDAWVNDLQETSNPLLQVVTKNVMADIRGKEMQAIKRVQEFKKAIADIKQRAKVAGVTINWDNIIDKDGKFVQDYNQAFLDKLEEHRSIVRDLKAKANDENATLDDYTNYLKAKLEYDKFKLENINQPVIDDYYREKIRLEEHMLTNFPTIYSRYSQLENKRWNISSHTVNGALEQHWQDELDKVNKEIDELTATYFYDPASGFFMEKFDENDPNNPYTDPIQRKLNGLNNANALNNFLSDMGENRKNHFARDTKFGFYEELDRNLAIVANEEMRDAQGRVTRSTAELMKNPHYVKAKEWLAQNAKFVVTPDVQDVINKAFRALGEKASGRKLLKQIAKQKDLYDNHGVIDGTKLTEAEITAIRKEQLANYNIRENQPLSDRTLISNAPTDDVVFSSDFYKKMTTDGNYNADYLKKVNEINEVLNKYYNSATQTVETSEISIEDLRTLKQLYKELNDIKKRDGSTNGRAVHAFIQNNVDFVYDMEKYEAQRDFARQKGGDYYRRWLEVNEETELDENGNIVSNPDGSDKTHPNRYLYGYAVPKGYVKGDLDSSPFVDKQKTEALRIVNSYCVSQNTEYYYQKYREMKAKPADEFQAWYDANHIYNPYTHKVEPIACWTQLSVNPMADEGTWIPAYNQTESRIQDGREIKDEQGNVTGYENNAVNQNYKQGSHASNYKRGNSAYDNTVAMNNYEQEMKNLFQTTLRAMANTTAANRFLDKGYMVARAKGQEKDAKFFAKELGKMLGWINTATGREAWRTDNEVDYASDRVIDMPMMQMLRSKESVTINQNPPKEADYNTQAEYQTALNEYNEAKKKADEQNAKIHSDLLDRNWESVMEDFIIKAAHFNAVQDNKYMLFYAKNMIDKLDVYIKNEGFNDFQQINSNDPTADPKYSTKKDTRLQEQYVNWIRRLVYDQWKKPNAAFTRGANILQSLTSAKFMMLNVTGGIANVTYGITQILGETFAKEYFGNKEWLTGMGIWHRTIPSFLADMYKERATSLPSAIVKFMNVVDFDELNGVVHVPDAAEMSKRIRDVMFSPQAMGEHGMQNGAMFAMMNSHRVVINRDKDNNGRLSYTTMNEAEFIRNANETALQSILTPTQKQLWDKFISHEKANANRTKSYAWFRKDLTTQFANLYLNDEQKKEFISKRRENQKKLKEEFNDDTKYPTLYSQLKLDEDGRLGFKDGSILEQMGDEAYQLLGEFKGRVISVNKKIHGVYDRLGAAKWESYWWGGLVMQYHKHLYPGIMKRYRRQGYYNEERGTIEKGCYASLKDFLALPFNRTAFVKKLKEDNNMTDAELQAVEGLQNIGKELVHFATHIKLYWNILPEYERSNIKRSLGDLCGVMSAVCLAIALRVMAGDDDDEQGFLYNLMMYEADRLASESFMYNPIGLYSEGKKLWSSPVAVQGSISDLVSTFGLVSQFVIQGDEFDPYYKTGLYAGENKFEVLLKRNIPAYHGIYMLERLEKSNKYYKLDENMLSIIPTKKIADSIRK